MAILSKQQLKELWVTGYTPTQTDYANLFDTLIAYVNGISTSNYKFISGGISTGADLDTQGFGILWYDSISTCDFLFIISGAGDTNASEGPRFLLYQGEDIDLESSLSKDETKTSEQIINIFVYGNPEGTGSPKNPIWELPTTPEVSLSANTTWSNLANLPDTSKLNLNTVLSSIFFALGLRKDDASPFRLLSGQQGDANIFGIVWVDGVNSVLNAVLFSAYGAEVPFISLYVCPAYNNLGEIDNDDALIQDIYNEDSTWTKLWSTNSIPNVVKFTEYSFKNTSTINDFHVLITPGSVTEMTSSLQTVRFTIEFAQQSSTGIDWKDTTYQPATLITPGYANVVFDERSNTTDISMIFYDADSPSEELMNHRTDTVQGNSGFERRIYTIRPIKNGTTNKCNLFISWKYYADGLYTYPPLE